MARDWIPLVRTPQLQPIPVPRIEPLLVSPGWELVLQGPAFRRARRATACELLGPEQSGERLPALRPAVRVRRPRLERRLRLPQESGSLRPPAAPLFSRP